MQYSCLLSSNKCYVGLKRFLSHPLFAWFSSSQSTSLGSEKPVLQLLPCSDCEGAGIDGHGCMVNKALEPLRRALKSCKDRAMVALVGLCTLGSWKWKNEAAVYGPVDTIKYPSCSILFKFKWYHLLGCIIFINCWYLHAIFFFFFYGDSCRNIPQYIYLDYTGHIYQYLPYFIHRAIVQDIPCIVQGFIHQHLLRW